MQKEKVQNYLLSFQDLICKQRKERKVKSFITLGEDSNEDIEDFLLLDFFDLWSMEVSLSPEVERILEFFRLSMLLVLVLGLGLEDDEETEEVGLDWALDFLTGCFELLGAAFWKKKKNI